MDEVVGLCEWVEFTVEGGNGGDIGAFEIEIEAGVGVFFDHLVDEAVDGVVAAAFGAGGAEQVIDAFVVDAEECGGLELLLCIADGEGESVPFLDATGADTGDAVVVLCGIEIIFFSIGGTVEGYDGFYGDARFGVQSVGVCLSQVFLRIGGVPVVQGIVVFL